MKAKKIMDDEMFNIKWPETTLRIVSEQDKKWPLFSEK